MLLALLPAHLQLFGGKGQITHTYGRKKIKILICILLLWASGLALFSFKWCLISGLKAYSSDDILSGVLAWEQCSESGTINSMMDSNLVSVPSH